MKQVEFEQVEPTEEQIVTLFNLLETRLHRISYEETSYAEHENFVNSHPYRDWFLIRVGDNYVGSFYITRENTIGINVSEKYTRLVFVSILSFVEDNFKPLAAIPSVRSGKFTINVSPTNTLLAEVLEESGAQIAQTTYYIPK